MNIQFKLQNSLKHLENFSKESEFKNLIWYPMPFIVILKVPKFKHCSENF